MLLDAVPVVPGKAVDVEVDADHDDAGDEEGDEGGYHRVRGAEVEGAHVLDGGLYALVDGGVAPSSDATWIALYFERSLQFPCTT